VFFQVWKAYIIQPLNHELEEILGVFNLVFLVLLIIPVEEVLGSRTRVLIDMFTSSTPLEGVGTTIPKGSAFLGPTDRTLNRSKFFVVLG
jgi:hypothetical protein